MRILAVELFFFVKALLRYFGADPAELRPEWLQLVLVLWPIIFDDRLIHE